MASLRDGADVRFYTAHGSASGDASHLNTALRWLERFIQVFPSRRLFVPHSGAGDVHAAAYNEETLRLFAEFIRRHGSVRRGREGEVVSASAISEYVSAIRAFRSREAGYNLLVSGGNLRLPLQLRHMRREDGPAGRRHLSRALTARILRRLLQKREFAPTNSRRHALRWAILWGGHNLLLRGGEFGCPDHKRFDPKVGLTVADFDWIAPCFETDWFYAVVVDVLPIKDERVTRDRVPVLIRRRCRWSDSSYVGEDPRCANDALYRWWDVRVSETTMMTRAAAPFFSLPDAAAVHTSEILYFVREAAAAADENPADFDGRALRIGGATDLYHLFGPAAAERHIADRGRWKSDIQDIYSRLSATAMLEVSARMGDASGVDLEAFRHGYTMPAVRRRPSRHR